MVVANVQRSFEMPCEWHLEAKWLGTVWCCGNLNPTLNVWNVYDALYF